MLGRTGDIARLSADQFFGKMKQRPRRQQSKACGDHQRSDLFFDAERQTHSDDKGESKPKKKRMGRGFADLRRKADRKDDVS